MYTLVGSRAMKNWFPDARDPKGDWDFFTPCEVGVYPVYPGCTDRVDVFEHPMLRQWDWKAVATADELYTIKVSHLFWVPNRNNNTWNKHMGDAIFLQRKGCQFIRPLYDILFPIWKAHYAATDKKTNTKMNKKKFFNDAVVRKYDHDSLHETVAYNSVPLYIGALKPGSEVDMDWNMFSNYCLESQLQMIREEIYVTALERILIPSDYTESPRAAYAWALRRCLTSLFRNEWALWIALHLDELRAPDVDFQQRHLDNRHLLKLNGE